MTVRAGVIFLDIDGVMLPKRAYALAENKAELSEVGSISSARPDRIRLHPDAIAALTEIYTRIPEVRLVLCTSWRHSVGVSETIACLERNGIGKAYWHEDRACPWMPPTDEAAGLGANTGSSKAEDIAAWLDRHRGTVSRWVALDDDGDLGRMLLSVAVPGVFVQIDGNLGLTQADVPTVLSAFACISN